MKEFTDGLVSVIVPVYNAARYIDKAIDSVLSQTYNNIEIILVDDCSKDNSADIIKGFCNKYTNIVYHRLETNQGAAIARNKALELASGRYVAFLDSDDFWHTDKTMSQLVMMTIHSAPMSYTAIDMVDEDDNQIKSKRNVRLTISYRFLLHNTMIATSSVIIDRRLMGDFRMPLLRSGQDYATWLYLLRRGTVAYGINEALVHYRKSPGSLSSNKLKSIKQVWQIQTQYEHINKASAFFNVCCFVVNASLKYIF